MLFPYQPILHQSEEPFHHAENHLSLHMVLGSVHGSRTVKLLLEEPSFSVVEVFESSPNKNFLVD